VAYGIPYRTRKGILKKGSLFLKYSILYFPRPYNEKETFSTQVALYGPRLYHLIVSFCGGVYREIDGKII